MEPRNQQRLVAVWQPESGIAVQNVKCGVFHLFVCFTTPYSSISSRPLSWGQGFTIHALLRGRLMCGLGLAMHE